MMDAGEGATESFEMTEITKEDLATAGDNPGYIADTERQHSTTEPGKDASAEILEIEVV